MTLTIHKEEDDKRQLLLTIEVAEERVDKAMRATARKLARDINIPGFRKGKVPYQVMLKRFGEDAIRAEAVEDMVNDVFEEALHNVDVETYGQPTFDDMEMEPLVLKFTIPLSPYIQLGAYRDVRKEIEPVTVTDEALAEALENLRARHQELETVERAAEAGDVVVVSGKGVLVPLPPAAEAEDGGAAEPESERTLFNEDSVELLLDSEKVFVGTPFVDNVIGMSAGEEKAFDFTFADDFEEEELAGRQAHFELTVLEVKNRTLPPLDDELAKLDGRFETLDELQNSVRENLQRQAEDEARDELIEGMVDELLKDVELVYPPAALNAELDDMLASFKEQAERSGWKWEDYLRLQGDSEEAIRERFAENAKERLERRLVLRELIMAEKLTVGEADVNALIEERVATMGDNADLQESMRNFYRQGYGLDMISSEILMNKVADRIKAIFSGEAPDLEAIAEAAGLAGDEEE